MEEIVQVGVTGHRFLAEVDRLERGVGEALDRVEAAHLGRRLVVLSPLAEGADRLVAWSVLRRPGGRLIGVLPLPLDDYLGDFETAESRAEFHDLLSRASEVVELPAPPTRDAGYEEVGRYIVDRADAMVALWDGKGVQGQGGTGAIVQRALARGIPVYHVKTGNRKPGTREPTSLGPEQGELVVYNP